MSVAFVLAAAAALGHPARSEGSAVRDAGPAFARTRAPHVSHTRPVAPLRATRQGGATYVVIITGASGEPQYAQSFLAAAQAIDEAARTRFNVPADAVIWLGEDTTKASGRIRGRSTRENVERELGALAARVRPGDQVWVVLIGHGSGEGEQSRFNLVGPDLTAADFARLLGGFAKQQVAFVNASSASGDFAKVLAAPNRVVVTATKSALERNESLFARHFAAALKDAAADVDKDGRVSLREAFDYAKREVARAYETDNRLLTEHAQLDDAGSLASVLALGGGTTSTDPKVVALVGERRALEAQVAALRARKESMDAAAYDTQLEALLLDLARKNQAIRAAEAAGGRKP